MQFTTTVAKLRSALTNASHAMTAKPALIAYSALHLRTVGQCLTVTGSDGDTTIAVTVNVGDAIDGETLLTPGPIGAFLATLSPTTTVTCSADRVNVTISSDAGQPYTFRILEATFPMRVSGGRAPVGVNLTGLALAVDAVAASVSKELPGVQLISDNDTLVLHTTDRYRLSRAVLPGAGFGEFTGVIPLAALERIARHDITGIAVEDNGRVLRAQGPEVSVTTKLLSLPFPDASGLLALDPVATVLVAAPALAKALTRLRSVAQDSPLSMSITGEEMILTVANNDRGAGSERLAVTGAAGATGEMSLKLDYFAEAVASHTSDQISIGWIAPHLPVVIRSDETPEVTNVLAPVRR